jgi:hypothetical protein
MRVDAMIVASVAIAIEIAEIATEIADAIVTAIEAEIANARSQFPRMMSCYQLAASWIFSKTTPLSVPAVIYPAQMMSMYHFIKFADMAYAKVML